MTYAVIIALLAIAAQAIRGAGLKAETVDAKARAARAESEMEASKLAIAKLDAQLRESQRNAVVLRDDNRRLYEKLGQSHAPGARDEYERQRARLLQASGGEGDPGAAADRELPPAAPPPSRATTVPGMPGRK